MKNKIRLSIIFAFLPLLLLGQTEPEIDKNGRTEAQLARQKEVSLPIVEYSPTATARSGGEDKDEGVYLPGTPVEFATSEDVANLNGLIQALSDQLAAGNLTGDQFEMELNTIKKSLEMCCGGANLEEKDEPSYLFQNAPNPFSETTNIQYFIPEDAVNAKLQIRDLTGVILKTHILKDKGFGVIQLARATFSSGSYVYTLEIDGQLTDSKIMILTK